jgi:hypothetical protein
VKKLLVLIGIAACFLSGCLPGSTGLPKGAPATEAQSGKTPSGDTVTEDQWSGWAQVPGGRTTDVSLAAAAFKNKLYLFAKGIDDKCIYFDTCGTSGNWSGWEQVPGGSTTDVALAPVVFNNELYVFAKGIDDKHIYFDICDTSGNWSGWGAIPGLATTDVAITASAFNNKLFLFSKGIHYKRIYVSVYDTTDSWSRWSAWNHWVEVRGSGKTDVSLAAASFNNQLYLFGKGISNNKLIYINTFGPAHN